jgi:hypothetical protein
LDRVNGRSEALGACLGRLGFGAIRGVTENLGSLQPGVAASLSNAQALAHQSKSDVGHPGPYRRFQQSSLNGIALRMAAAKLVEPVAFRE